MLVTTIKTRKIKAKDSITDLLDTYIKKLSENSIVAITSKIISICENHLVRKDKNKLLLIKEEADKCFKPFKDYPDFCLTIKNNRLIPNAGIDESNYPDHYVLLPSNPQLTAKKTWDYLRKKHQISNLGIIITDSTVSPLRAGVTGIGIGWCGFDPTYSYIGQKDIFGSILKVSKINILDSIATIATLAMGEGKEQTPISIIKSPPNTIKFKNSPPTKKDEQKIIINPNVDIFKDIIKYE